MYFSFDITEPIHILFSGRPQIISSAVVLAVSLVLGAISLMGLSQGDGEQIGYEALSRATVTGINDELRPPGGREDQQQQQQADMTNSPSCSINSGSALLNFPV